MVLATRTKVIGTERKMSGNKCAIQATHSYGIYIPGICQYTLSGGLTMNFHPVPHLVKMFSPAKCYYRSNICCDNKIAD